MNIPGFFIGRPITTTLVTSGILLFGWVAYRALPVNDLPNVDYPTLQVSAALPGASPETMASAIATPLERQFTTIAGLDSMTSSSQLGSTSITMQFSLNRNIDAAGQDVQAAISKTLSQLPQNMPSPPTYQKVNPADQPILFIVVSSKTLPLYRVDEFAETLMAQRISTVSGVAQVQVYGAQKYAVRIELNPDALAARGLGIDEVQAAVANANVNLPTGTLNGSKQAFTVESTGQLEDAAAYRPIIVAYKQGQPVRLQDVAIVEDSVQNNKAAAWFNGERSIVLAVQRQPGTNTIEVVNGVRTLLPSFRSQIPPSVNISIMYDRSVSIRDSISDVKFTLLLTVALVVMVIFVFLRNISATLIPSLAVPLAIIGTFSVMYLLGYTVDNLSLMALTLSVGFVVDDAIVMLENIVRHIENGETRMDAAYRGSREIGFTIVSMTISLVAVFIPVLFMGGIVGRLMHEFAVTISVAILVSGFVSLSLTPMLCSRFLRFTAHQSHGALYRISERGFEWVARMYDRTLVSTMRHGIVTMGVSFLLLFGTVYLFTTMPKGFIPSQDSGFLFGLTQAAQGSSFDYMVNHQDEVIKIVRADPNTESVFSFVGAGFVGAMNTGIFFVKTKPRDQRPNSVDGMIDELRPKLMFMVPGMIAFMQNPPPISVSGQITKSLYALTLGGPDIRDLYKWAPILTAKIGELPGFADVTSDLQIASPQITVDINRDKAQAVGVTPQQIEDALYTAYGDRQISTIFTPANEYQVIAEVLPEYQNNPAALSRLYIRSGSSSLIPLDTVASMSRTVAPLTVQHSGQLPAVTISFNLRPGFSLGDAADRVNDTVRELQMPATITTNFQGTVQAYQTSFKGLSILLIVAIAVIYLVLGILYESFIHPITILWGLPSAVVGALLTLKIFHMDLDLFALVGLVMLFGIVKKNAIMMIDFALDAQRTRNVAPAQAIYQGAIMRFRPIMMTTMAALFGTLPIALGFGAGAESRRPLGMAVVGGLLVSQLLTLYITPVTYVYMEKFRGLFTRRQAKPELVEQEV
ncbi:MAG: efflux RND transporter permease subunit [Bryobacteraceae bacterium]|jgi:HAE1 family hydrophobic/amphiphilic exporter-1